MFKLYARTDITSGFIAGEDREFDFSYIIAEFDNGARYALRDSDVCSLFENSYGFAQRRDAEEIEALQQRRIAKMQGKPLNLAECWYEIEPVYGSDAYINRPRLAEMMELIYKK